MNDKIIISTDLDELMFLNEQEKLKTLFKIFK